MLQILSNDHQIELKEENGLWFINDKEVRSDIQALGAEVFHILLEDKSYQAIIEQVDRAAKTMIINIDGQRIELQIREPIDQLIKSMGLDMSTHKKAESIKAPMPGMVLKLLVKEGDKVEKGSSLIILEAMKMENVLKAGAEGTVKKINVSEKTAVEKGTVLIEME